MTPGERTFSERERELLDGPNICMVAVVTAQGSPRVVPTWVGLEGEEIRLVSDEQRLWWRELVRSREVAMAVLNHEDPQEYVSIRGVLLDQAHEGADAYVDRLGKVYLGVESYPYRTPGVKQLLFRIRPTHVRHVKF
jgi:hypothetical protein